MAYDTTKAVTLGQVQTIASRTKSDYTAAIEEAASGSSGSTIEVATDEEVSEMLDELFGTTADATEEN